MILLPNRVPNAPRISMATGTKQYTCPSIAYLQAFLSSTTDATLPAAFDSWIAMECSTSMLFPNLVLAAFYLCSALQFLSDIFLSNPL